MPASAAYVWVKGFAEEKNHVGKAGRISLREDIRIWT